MKSEKVLITGCGGMLGSDFYVAAQKIYSTILATDIDINESWLSYLDVRDIGAVEKIFNEFKPQIVFHLAALTDMEHCETQVKDCWATNALGTENIAIIAEKINATVVYISTAGIFGGEKDEFHDFDIPHPLSMYAKSKYHGERFVQEYIKKYFVFRAGWMMGGGIKKDKKFIKKIYDQIKSGKKEIFVVDDKFGTPTYTKNFSESMLKVIQTGYYGVYNQSGEGGGSRYEVAVEFIKLLDLFQQIKVTRVSSDFFKNTLFAPRPVSEKMINLKLNMRNINHMEDWKKSLKEYSEVFKKDYYRLV